MTGLDPSARQMVTLRQLFDEQRQLFAADPGSAEKLINVGEAKADASMNKPDLAAGTVLAQTLFNFDDTIMRR
jgi:hypothetical protein